MLEEYCPICADELLVPYLSARSKFPCYTCLKCGCEFPELPVPRAGIVVAINRMSRQVEDGETNYLC